MISFISSFEMINAVVPEPRIFLWITGFAAASVNPNDTKTLLANDVSKFLINGKPGFSNDTWSRPRNSLDYILLEICFFWVIYSAEWLAEASWSLTTCLLVIIYVKT